MPRARTSLRNQSALARILVAFAGISALAALPSCGNAPMDVLGDNQEISQNLSLPIAQGLWGSFTGVNINTRVFQFGGGAGSIPLAPAPGMVVDLTGSSITILHSARLATRITGISQPIVRAGDFVSSGSQLSNVNFSGSAFSFEVLLDGQRVCPWSFLSSQTRLVVTGLGWFTGAPQPCTQD